ncbi:hypothetical protein B0H11DRAFT_2273858 [Mycena galericulata]|nr:hypothetical protein B0H11DRAFT_2273858 [Mycena galericulata]
MTINPPTEIWRIIIRLATTSGAGSSISLDYAPFQSPDDWETADNDQQARLRLRTCANLMRVSHFIREVAAEFLYEDVQLADERSLQSFWLGLQRSCAEDDPYGFGKFVRRLEMLRRPVEFRQGDTHNRRAPSLNQTAPIHLFDILRHCPFLEILIRPLELLRDMRFWESVFRPANEETPPLPPSLELKWLGWHENTLYAGHANGTALLTQIVARSHRLKRLDVTTDRPNALSSLSLPPTLTTLRLRGCGQLSPHMKHTSAHTTLSSSGSSITPNLTHLIVAASPAPAVYSFLSAGAGRTIRVLEFISAPQAEVSPASLQHLLHLCPQIEELTYRLGAPELCAEPYAHGDWHYPALMRVRLYIDAAAWGPPRYIVKREFDVLASALFPGLREVVLHDDSGWLCGKATGKAMLTRMVDRGCSVEYADGTAIDL